MTPLIFQKLGIKCDSPKHEHAHSTQELVSPKELARAEEGPTGLCQLNEQRSIRSSFSLPREPNTRSSPRTARGTPVQFQGTNKPLHA